jgi:serine/threonine protein phosphatase 1
LIDRGPNSHACLALVDHPWFFATRGYHEAMLLEAEFEGKLAMWMANGGEWYMGLSETQKERCVKWALSMPLAITLLLPDGRKIGVCHAEWPESDWAFVGEAVRDMIATQAMLWGRRILSKEKAQTDLTASLTVHGHTPIDAPRRLGTALFIDTGCVYGGTHTLVSVEQALAIPGNTGKKPSMLSRLRGFRNRS